jgi:hypothetical protein
MKLKIILISIFSLYSVFSKAQLSSGGGGYEQKKESVENPNGHSGVYYSGGLAVIFLPGVGSSIPGGEVSIGLNKVGQKKDMKKFAIGYDINFLTLTAGLLHSTYTDASNIMVNFNAGLLLSAQRRVFGYKLSLKPGICAGYYNINDYSYGPYGSSSSRNYQFVGASFKVQNSILLKKFMLGVSVMPVMDLMQMEPLGTFTLFIGIHH